MPNRCRFFKLAYANFSKSGYANFRETQKYDQETIQISFPGKPIKYGIIIRLTSSTSVMHFVPGFGFFLHHEPSSFVIRCLRSRLWHPVVPTPWLRPKFHLLGMEARSQAWRQIAPPCLCLWFWILPVGASLRILLVCVNGTLKENSNHVPPLNSSGVFRQKWRLVQITASTAFCLVP